MEKLKINVIDGIMGSGKSSGMINKINYLKNKNPDNKFLIIVPYLDEVERYSASLRGFKALVKSIPPKKITLEKYLKENKDIICTHQLFLQNSELIVNYASGYTLVIDEAINSLISVFDFPKLINSERINTDIKIQSDNTLTLKENASIYSFGDDDLTFLFNKGYLKLSSDTSNLIIWDDTKPLASIYSCLRDYFIQNDVYRLTAKHELEEDTYYYISLFPIKTFRVFKDIFIMTYLWDAQMMKYYFDFYGSEYHFLYPVPAFHISGSSESLNNINSSNYNLEENFIDFENKDFFILDNKKFYKNFEFTQRIQACKNIYLPGYTYNIQRNIYAKNPNSKNTLYFFWNKNRKVQNTITLSYNFYQNIENNKQVLSMLKNNVNKFTKDNLPTSFKHNNKRVIWSVFDCAKDSFSNSRGHFSSTNYIPINSKATNQYKDANVLIYLVNRFINPHYYNFIKNYCPSGENFDEDLYALSELLQWIWRSAIRDNKPVCIYIPSERMLNLLLNWLNNDI